MQPFAPLLTYSRMIKLSHSIFAMPFALTAALFAARTVSVTPAQGLLLVGALVTARSSAMGFNRLVDRDIDARNPRTASREIPSGQISVAAAWAFTIASALLFALCCALLGRTVLYLCPVALAIVWGYSLTKRFTALCHAVLGVALALAPTGVWIALTDSYGPVPLLLSLAVATWVSGFDIIYACQDASFDQENGLNSVPSRLGVGGALLVSALLHVCTAVFLLMMPLYIELGPVYLAGVAIIAGVLAYEHAIVKPNDLSRVNKAFFDLNGAVSLLFFAAVWIDGRLV